MIPTKPKSDESDLMAGRHLRHPVVLTMLALWLLNDHVLKTYYGSWWTGKLSDVAGLVVFPVSIYSSYEIICALGKRAPSHLKSVLWSSLTITAFILTMINTSPIAERLCSDVIAYLQWPIRAIVHLLTGHALPELNRLQTTMDITDLFTLPALIVPYKILERDIKTRRAL